MENIIPINPEAALLNAAFKKEGTFTLGTGKESHISGDGDCPACSEDDRGTLCVCGGILHSDFDAGIWGTVRECDKCHTMGKTSDEAKWDRIHGHLNSFKGNPQAGLWKLVEETLMKEIRDLLLKYEPAMANLPTAEFEVQVCEMAEWILKESVKRMRTLLFLNETKAKE
ncbi:MAG: hypothetical protein JWO50_302 [Candidatus Kaiserbacteria bacterium]|nr:hypothetical protein [Candidatus Kaiserbacteria bacterium]